MISLNKRCLWYRISTQPARGTSFHISLFLKSFPLPDPSNCPIPLRIFFFPHISNPPPRASEIAGVTATWEEKWVTVKGVDNRCDNTVINLNSPQTVMRYLRPAKQLFLSTVFLLIYHIYETDKANKSQ